jgi:acetolactate synthase-1/2/3 large subunit
MTRSFRGANVLTETLARAGVRHLFSLSGNQIMPVYDAALDANLPVVHVRHEGAAVHMADAWGRLTGKPGVALVTGGPGHANGIGALATALAAESPMVLLSGHAPLRELGKGAFQEMQQAEMAAPVTKASWTAASADTLGAEIARAMRIARSGRPGPVHVSLPFDVLEATVDRGRTQLPAVVDFEPQVVAPADPAVHAVLTGISRATRPLILAGPALAAARGAALRAELAAATGCPVVAMESPRGINDPGLGAFADVLREADLIVLLGKQPDFTLQFGRPPAVDAASRFIIIDPDRPILERSCNTLGADRVLQVLQADGRAAAERLRDLATGGGKRNPGWNDEVRTAIAYRPADWSTLASPGKGPLHAVEVGRAVQQLVDSAPECVLVIDGGEFGQWAQACVNAPQRLINGPAGSIGSAIPFALAARLACPNATVITMLGDGTFGFHAAEFDTATRNGIAFVAIVGNDACWNAEYQIQLRTYGKPRAIGCELLPLRYDQVAAAFGGHGEYVARNEDLSSALARAARSGQAACVNVAIERAAAPVVSRRTTGASAAATH